MFLEWYTILQYIWMVLILRDDVDVQCSFNEGTLYILTVKTRKDELARDIYIILSHVFSIFPVLFSTFGLNVGYYFACI